ncbi:hypothetical protein F3Y22_tig00111167pilonHSYRG00007 [Hibiscus syriacus]|uniref:Uncharacterized protein n=1 Tax=Hibiscus syriacus TaxID=106335 RepID=A0A6A2YWI3_HIBSY|nr:hypothetical protein F3Y22_tig00111167pilonHSYRG00007 [Hibiscus syriacus]
MRPSVGRNHLFILGQIKQTIGKSTGAKRSKVIFHDFPGGAGNFELISMFCYNNGKIDINPSNISLLYSAARFMEMKDSISGNCSLFEKTEKYIEEIGAGLGLIFWWLRNMAKIYGRQQLLQQVLVHLLLRIASGFGSRAVPKVPRVRNMASLEQLGGSKTFRQFLVYYQKSKFHITSSDEKHKALEVVIDMLCILVPNSFSCKSLFGILRVVLNLHIRKSSRCKLEDMIAIISDSNRKGWQLIRHVHSRSSSGPLSEIIQVSSFGNGPARFRKGLRGRTLLRHRHLLGERKIPIEKSSRALASRQLKLRNFLQGTDHTNSSYDFTENTGKAKKMKPASLTYQLKMKSLENIYKGCNAE